jgi:hypothetical protein
MTVVHLLVITQSPAAMLLFFLYLIITHILCQIIALMLILRKAEKMSSFCSLNFCIIFFYTQNDLKILQYYTEYTTLFIKLHSDYVRTFIANDYVHIVQPRFASVVLRSLGRLSEARLPRYALYTTVLLHT